ncbi:MAG: permease-like cell division protein FtsX, partial [Clostridia bacterium]|nr:permease-like cell division protein FtsX [Clostridia bacterium]
MKRYNLFYFIGQALSGLWRNGVMSIASIAVLMSCLVVIGGFALLVMTIDVNLEQFGLINEIVVYCNTEATEEEILTVGDQIRKLDNIESVTRVTKAEGLAEMKEKYDKIYDDVDESTNPLPDK